MHCSKCGHTVEKGSQFCSHCGKEIASQSLSAKHDQLTSKVSPYPYIVTQKKLIIMSITTFGLYEAYWFYRQFKSFKAETDWKVIPWVMALFSSLSAQSLFDRVSTAVKEIDPKAGLPTFKLALAYFVFRVASRAPGIWFLLSFLSFIPLIYAQKQITYYWTEKYGKRVQPSTFGASNIAIAALGSLWWFFVIVGAFAE